MPWSSGDSLSPSILNIRAGEAALATGFSTDTLQGQSGTTVNVISDLSAQKTLAAQRAELGGVPSSTSGVLSLKAHSQQTDYIHFQDSAALKSNFLLGLKTGDSNASLVDGLNLYDESHTTTIVRFSSDSVRFYPPIVAPVFDAGGALASTYNAALFLRGGSHESQIQAAIIAAAADGVARVYVPASMYPYSSGSISFDTRVQMVREGGDWSVFDVRAYGAYNNKSNGTHTFYAFKGAIDAVSAGTGGSVHIPEGSYSLASSPTIASDHIEMQGAGNSNSVLFPTAGPALVVNTSNGGALGPVISSLGIRSESTGIAGQYILDVLTGLPTLRDINISTGGNASGWSGAVRIQDVNNCVVDNIHIQGEDTDRWRVGLDLCSFVTGNRGNITILGGIVNRATIGAQIASAITTNVVNNIQMFGTKFLFSGSGTTIGGIGISAYTSRLLGFHGVHIESYDIGMQLSTVLGAILGTCRLSNFATPAGSANQLGVSIKSSCNQIIITGCEFDSGTVSLGTAVNIDATNNAEIHVIANRFASQATAIVDNGTGSNRLVWSTSGGQFNFWFKDKLRANSHMMFNSNVNLVAGNNNNFSPPAGGTWRITSSSTSGAILTGIALPVTGQRFRLEHVSGSTLTIAHNNAASLATQAMWVSSLTDYVMLTDDIVDVEYDASLTRWRVIQKNNPTAGVGAAVLPSYAFSSERSLGFYNSGISTIAQSYGTFNLNQSRLVSVRTQGSLDSTTLAQGELAISIAVASGASLALRSGNTIYYWTSSASTKG